MILKRINYASQWTPMVIMLTAQLAL
jgi:hypothetical protein